uniref:Uncharacterized protein n=1 Tax=Timema cristinae TaxID=61476 RepID=A0A7R9CBP1_TIMCR|nr:unnamed protein product [Timema cristinae]
MHSSPMASLVLTDSSQLTYYSQHLELLAISCELSVSTKEAMGLIYFVHSSTKSLKTTTCFGRSSTLSANLTGALTSACSAAMFAPETEGNTDDRAHGAVVKMEHFQAALDPRKQELLEARFLGARPGDAIFLRQEPTTRHFRPRGATRGWIVKDTESRRTAFSRWNATHVFKMQVATRAHRRGRIVERALLGADRVATYHRK